MKGISKDFSVGDINDVANFATQLAKYEDDLDSFRKSMKILLSNTEDQWDDKNYQKALAVISENMVSVEKISNELANIKSNVSDLYNGLRELQDKFK